MSSKAPIIVTLLLSCIFIAGLAGSSYSLGIHKDNRSSDEYQISSAFTSITATLTIVSILVLIVLVGSYASSPEYPPVSPY